MVLLLVASAGLVGCSKSENIAKRDCRGLNGKACLELIENRSGGAATSDYTKLDVVGPEGIGRSTILTVSSPDAITYRWEGKQLFIEVRGGLVEGFKSYWFNPDEKTHYPDGDLTVALSHL